MKAMILAAGHGQRMRPLTKTTPKPLLPVGGQLLIDYHLNALAQAGIHEVVINVCYHGDKIIEYVGDGKRYGLEIQFSLEHKGCLGTGGGIQQALPLLGHQPFILLSADIFTDFPLQVLLESELLNSFDVDSENKLRCLAHIILVNNPSYHPDGDFTLDKQGMIQLNGSHKLTYANIALIHPKLFFDSKPMLSVFPLSDLFKKAIAMQAMTGQIYQGFWDNIGTPQQLEILNQMLSSDRAHCSLIER